jgi:hypothetical protein
MDRPGGDISMERQGVDIRFEVLDGCECGELYGPGWSLQEGSYTGLNESFVEEGGVRTSARETGVWVIRCFGVGGRVAGGHWKSP